MRVRPAEIRWPTDHDELLEALTGGKPRLSIVVEHWRRVQKLEVREQSKASATIC
jgi:hypothetical protein